jgi:GNAT superfamily N-acetyltransferase
MEKQTCAEKKENPFMKIRELTLTECEEVYESYMTEDFPENERKPFSAIAEMREKGIYKGYGLFSFAIEEKAPESARDEESFLAYWFMAVYEEEKTMLLDYLAVRKELRGSGYGQKVIRAIRDNMNSGYTLFIESEDPEYAENTEDKGIRQRRMRFYQNCGCHLSEMRTEIVSTSYRVFILSKERDDEKEWKRRYRALYSDIMMPKERFVGHVLVDGIMS